MGKSCGRLYRYIGLSQPCRASVRCCRAVALSRCRAVVCSGGAVALWVPLARCRAVICRGGAVALWAAPWTLSRCGWGDDIITQPPPPWSSAQQGEGGWATSGEGRAGLHLLQGVRHRSGGEPHDGRQRHEGGEEDESSEADGTNEQLLEIEDAVGVQRKKKKNKMKNK